MAVTDKVENMTIDTFVPESERARVSYEICKQVLIAPEQFRLVFVDLEADGLFHLRNAMVNFWRGREDILSESVETFMDELGEAIRAWDFTRFRAKYLQPQILLLDDMHLLERRETTQQELYGILKTRLEQKKLTILFSPYSLSQIRLTVVDELTQLLRLGLHETQ